MTAHCVVRGRRATPSVRGRLDPTRKECGSAEVDEPSVGDRKDVPSDEDVEWRVCNDDTKPRPAGLGVGDRADDTGRALTSREVLVPSRGHLRTSAFVKEPVLGKVLGHAALGEPLGICALMRRYC